jgi:hypothetical protein
MGSATERVGGIKKALRALQVSPDRNALATALFSSSLLHHTLSLGFLSRSPTSGPP